MAHHKNKTGDVHRNNCMHMMFAIIAIDNNNNNNNGDLIWHSE